MSDQNIFDDPQPRDLRINHFKRAAIRTFGELQNFTRIHEADQFKANSITLPIQLKPGNALVNQKLTFSSPLSAQRQLHSPEIPKADLNPKMQPNQISVWIKERQALREMMDESPESMTRKFLLKKECNTLEKRYLAAGEQEKCGSSPNPKDPYSRILMFYQYLMFNFGRKRVDLIKKFFSTHNQALSVRFSIFDAQNRGYIHTEDVRNICLQFAKPNTKEIINELLEFVEENGSIFYKSLLVSPGNISDLKLYGKGSKLRISSVGKIDELSPIITTDQVIQQKREEFEKLVQVCKENDIVLSEHSLEKALLLPENRTMDDIISHFTGISLEPPNPKPGFLYGDGNSSDSSEGVKEPKSIKVFLPKRKKVLLSTRDKPKVDCWLTFDDYQKIVSQLQRNMYPSSYPLPHSSKRYLADPNAFWPGSYLDRQHPYLPHTPKSLRPNHVHFQQVDRRFNRADIPNKHGISVWPTNEAGYVQHGTLSDKQCAL